MNRLLSNYIPIFGFGKDIQIMVLLWYDVEVLNIPSTPLTRPWDVAKF